MRGGFVLSDKTCIHCKESKSLEHFHKDNGSKAGLRPECKGCAYLMLQKRKNNNKYITTLNNMADNIIKRVITQVDRPINTTYRERGIKSLIGTDRASIRENLHKYYSYDIKRLLYRGERPSVDRIDSYGHYEIGNIQIIPLHENIRRADRSSFSRRVETTFPDGSIKVFQSINIAAKELGCKRDTIYSGEGNPGTNRRGLHFRFLDEGITKEA